MSYAAVLIWATICTIIVFFLLLSLEEANGEISDKYWTLMCSLTTEEPFYNCENKWVIVIHDSVTVKTQEDVFVFGYAAWGGWNLCDKYPIMDEKYCNLNHVEIGSLKRDGCWNEICYPLLWHELIHLRCECNWHQNMTSYSIWKDI